jgi:hypothetical protein
MYFLITILCLHHIFHGVPPVGSGELPLALDHATDIGTGFLALRATRFILVWWSSRWNMMAVVVEHGYARPAYCGTDDGISHAEEYHTTID